MQAINKDNLGAIDISKRMEEIEHQMRNGELTLDEAADALLAASGQLGQKHGTYTEAQLTRKMRDENKRLPEIQHDAIPEEVNQRGLNKRVDELIELARLRPIEEICFRLSISNLNAREIAQTLGFGRHRVELHLMQARRRLRRVYRDGPYAGWFEVYLSEVRRGRKERHSE